ncbi:MAG: peptidoglycan DD-metalloendopeptidase family protein [Beijerinckiaceae bacterium]|nr:peptidoglycan DD-metalloendopeptidase family protein [Beijerinckiaceae bacterium]
MTILFERVKPRLLASVMVASLVAACSSDTARFNDNPFQNPFNSRTSFDPVSTASIDRIQPNAPLRAAPSGSVTTQALPPPTQPMMRASPQASAPTATGSVASASYPALAPVAPRPGTALGATQGWTAVGGTPIVLQQGESLGTLSSRYGVPVSALLAVNGLSSVNQAQPGQQIMIPAYSAVQGAGSTTAPRRVASAVPSRETLAEASPARPATRPAVRDVTGKPETEAERRAATKLKQLRTRDEAEDEAPAARPAAKAAAQPMPPLPEKKITEQKRLEAERGARQATKKVPVAEPETTASIPEPKVTARNAERPAAVPAPAPQAEEPAEQAANFRWPAQGRVISGFGAKGASGTNDGINIAVPEGTPVRAAEGGTVIHADDALKGYGKLVLVRHPNGYVSVYAHNGEIKVKRGESVKRGQVIAASGSSGNVTSPQLHFQIRKGSQAVDPMKMLSVN